MPAPEHPTTARLPRWQPLLRWLTCACLLGLVGALAWHTTGDLDAPLHDRLGRDLLAGHPAPSVNHFSHTAPDHPWLNHEWGFQVLVATAGKLARGDDLAGRAVGWQWLRLGLVLALMAVLLAATGRGRRSAHDLPLALLGPVALLSLAMLWTRLTIRPELISYLCLALVLWRVEAALRSPAPARPWLELIDPRGAAGQALLIALFWYQCHGFAILAPLVWLLAGLLGRSPRPVADRWRLAIGACLVGLAAGVATPSGLPGLLYPLRALGQFSGGVDLQHTISELVPLLETRGSLSVTLLAYTVSLAWGVVWIAMHWRRVSLLRAVLWLAAAVAAWQGQRNLGFYAVAFLLLHGDRGPDAATHWAHLVGYLPARVRALVGPAAGWTLPLVTCVVAGFWFTALLDDSFYLGEGVARRWGAGLTPANYPVQQARRLADEPPLRLANTVDAASTLIAADSGPVAIDGRTEAYPAAVWRQYADLKQGGNTALRRLEQWRAEGVCLVHRNPAAHALLRTLLAHPAWVVADADPAGILLLPRAAAPGVATEDVLRRSSDTLKSAMAAAAPGRDVRLADQAAAWATLLDLAGQAPVAEDFLVLALDRCDDHPTVLHNLGNQYLARGEFRGALRLFERAARINRAAAPPLVNAGTCLFRLGRFDAAERAFTEATSRDSDNFEAWANLAELRRRRNDRSGAEEAYRRALELRPEDPRLRERLRSL